MEATLLRLAVPFPTNPKSVDPLLFAGRPNIEFIVEFTSGTVGTTDAIEGGLIPNDQPIMIRSPTMVTPIKINPE